MMRFRIVLFATCSCCAMTQSAPAEKISNTGRFVGRFHVDRWGQGVFGHRYVDPSLFPRLKPFENQLIKLEVTAARQWLVPGGAMITTIGTAERLPKTSLRLSCSVKKPAVQFGRSSQLTVFIENKSDKPISLYRRDLSLNVTVHKRGVTPGEKKRRYQFFDSHHNSYTDHENIKTVERDGEKIIVPTCVRATSFVDLLRDKGDICWPTGSPALRFQKNGKTQFAGLYDEQLRAVPAQGSVTFSYSIGEDWPINEYEFAIRYRSSKLGKPGRVSSAPVSFDVVRIVRKPAASKRKRK